MTGRVDSSTGPAEPLPYTPGYDLEEYGGQRWILYRTTQHNSIEVARGRTLIGALFAIGWRSILRPVRR